MAIIMLNRKLLLTSIFIFVFFFVLFVSLSMCAVWTWTLRSSLCEHSLSLSLWYIRCSICNLYIVDMYLVCGTWYEWECTVRSNVASTCKYWSTQKRHRINTNLYEHFKIISKLGISSMSMRHRCQVCSYTFSSLTKLMLGQWPIGLEHLETTVYWWRYGGFSIYTVVKLWQVRIQHGKSRIDEKKNSNL